MPKSIYYKIFSNLGLVILTNNLLAIFVIFKIVELSRPFSMIFSNSVKEERERKNREATPRHHKLNFMKYTTVKRSRIPRKLENLLTNKVCSTSTLFSRTRVRRAPRQ